MQATPHPQELSDEHSAAHHYTHVGIYLRELREHYRLELQEVSERLHIRPKYLQAIEEGNVQGLPAKVYAVGYIQNYAEFLGLKPDEVVGAYDELVELDKRPAFNVTKPGKPKNMPGFKWFILALGLGFAAMAIWQIILLFEPNPSEFGVEPVPQRLAEKAQKALIVTQSNQACMQLKPATAFPPCYPLEASIISHPFALKPVRSIMELR